MGRISEALERFFTEVLDADGKPVERKEGATAFNFQLQGESGTWPCLAEALEEQEQAVFYSVCPVPVPEERRPTMAELLTRANYGFIVGNFEMDFEDGEVRFKTAIDVEGTELAPALVRGVVVPNVTAMDHYLPGLLALIEGRGTPLSILAELEPPNEDRV